MSNLSDEESKAMAHDETNRTDRRTFLQAVRWPRPRP